MVKGRNVRDRFVIFLLNIEWLAHYHMIGKLKSLRRISDRRRKPHSNDNLLYFKMNRNEIEENTISVTHEYSWMKI